MMLRLRRCGLNQIQDVLRVLDINLPILRDRRVDVIRHVAIRVDVRHLAQLARNALQWCGDFWRRAAADNHERAPAGLVEVAAGAQLYAGCDYAGYGRGVVRHRVLQGSGAL
jgi:hypothetical protein